MYSLNKPTPFSTFSSSFSTKPNSRSMYLSHPFPWIECPPKPPWATANTTTHISISKSSYY
jgi:hypothetical protein